MTIKKIFQFTTVTLCFLVLGYSFSVFAQDAPCDGLHFAIEGIQNTVVDQSHQYSLSVNYQSMTWNELTWFDLNSGQTGFLDYVLQNSKVSYQIFFEKKLQQTIYDKVFFYAFPQLGGYIIQSNISFNQCSYQIEKSIKVFDTSYVYMGPFLDDFNFGLLENIQQQGSLLHTFIVPDTVNIDEVKFLSNLQQQIAYLHNSQDIFINIENYGLIFSTLGSLQKQFGIDFNTKNVFIIAPNNKQIVKKFLVKFTKESGLQSVYVIERHEFDQILVNLSIDKQGYDQVLLQESSMDFSKGKVHYSLSYLIDYLIFHGFPLDTIKLLLAIALAVVLIVFCKQVIGLSSFGVYYPLLFGFALHTVGPKTSFGLLLIAFLARFLIGFALKKTTILVSAKLGLYIIVYAFLTILGIVAYKMLIPHSDFVIFTNPMIMIVFVVILMIGNKLRTKTIPFKSIQRRKELLRFVILSFLIYIVLSSNSLHQVLLLYPILILIAAIVTLLIGKFVGLQVVEYLRFRPLITHLRKKTSKK